MYCAHCGAGIPHHATFCLQCGDPVVSAASLQHSDLINIAIVCAGVAESTRDPANGYSWPHTPFAGTCEIKITDLLTRDSVSVAYPAQFVIYAYTVHGQTTTICSATVQTGEPFEQAVIAFLTAQCGRGWNLLPIIQRLRRPHPSSPQGQRDGLDAAPSGAETALSIQILNIDLQRT